MSEYFERDAFPIATPRPWWTKAMRYRTTPDLSLGGFVGETMTVWGFCGCGSPDVVIDDMRAFLKSREDRMRDTRGFERWKAEHAIYASPAYLYCAYLADAAGWTEHGGSVGSSWLKPAGKAWLADADAYVAYRDRGEAL